MVRFRRAKRTSMISIRLEPTQRDFLKKNNFSATRVLDEAINKLRKRRRVWQ